MNSIEVTKAMRFVASFWVLAMAPTLVTHAQESDAPSFDPNPVVIPGASHATPRPATSKDLLKIRDLHGLSISPDAKYVAFVVGEAVYETNAYRSGVFVVGTEPGSTPVCLGTAGLPEWNDVNRWAEEAPQWSQDDKYIMRRARMNRTEKLQVWRWTKAGGQPVQVTHFQNNVQSYKINPGNKQILAKVEQPPSVAEVDRLATNGILYDGKAFVTRNRKVVEEALATNPVKTETWIHNLVTGAERVATETDIAAFRGLHRIDDSVASTKTIAANGGKILEEKVSPNGRLLAYKTFADNSGSSNGAIYRLIVVSLESGTATSVGMPKDPYLVADFWWSSDSTELYYMHQGAEGRPAQLMVVSLKGGEPKAVLGDIGYTLAWSMDRDLSHMACSRESATIATEVIYVDLRTALVRPLVDLNPEFKNLQLSSPVRIEGTNELGDSWYAHLVKPLNYEVGKRYPTIVTTYRSGDYFLRGASGDVNPIQVYAANGFAVLSFDMGRDRYTRAESGKFEDWVLAEASPVVSMEMAIRRGYGMGIVDRDKVGVAGYSRGTEQVAYAITHTKLFKAASGAAGDGSPFFYNMAPTWVKAMFGRWGLSGWPEGATKSKWKQIAPDLNADRIDAPVLNNDSDSEFLDDLALYTSLKELGKPVELFIYPNEGHTVSQPRHRYQIYERNIDWFRFWLKGEEDADPAKASQYDRWRNLQHLQKATSIDNPGR